MRKKIFAILMSAMMMVTFMPAMAFATEWTPLDATPSSIEGVFTVSETSIGAVAPVSGDAFAKFNYDGKDHVVAYVPKKGTGFTTSVEYEYTFNNKVVATKASTVTVKDAGQYMVKATVTKTWVDKGHINSVSKPLYLNLRIDKRPVWMIGSMNYEVTKVYDGNKVGVTDADFTIVGDYDKTTQTYKANTGLVAGDKLIVKSLEFGPNVGSYPIVLSQLLAATNPNYNVKMVGFSGITLKIVAAKPTVKILSNTLTIKAGKSKAVKFSTDLGTAKLTKTAGTAKIQLKNGKLVVKKGTKKGTYKITLKAKVAASSVGNWVEAYRTKVVKVKVK